MAQAAGGELEPHKGGSASLSVALLPIPLARVLASLQVLRLAKDVLIGLLIHQQGLRKLAILAPHALQHHVPMLAPVHQAAWVQDQVTAGCSREPHALVALSL